MSARADGSRADAAQRAAKVRRRADDRRAPADHRRPRAVAQPLYRARTLAIVATALMSTTGYAADGVGVCGTIRLGETTVATLQNAPVITLFANGAAITLLLDTGAQTTVLAPDAAERIGARRPRGESSGEMQAIA